MRAILWVLVLQAWLALVSAAVRAVVFSLVVTVRRLGSWLRRPTGSPLRRRADRRADQTSTMGEPRRQPRSNHLYPTTGDLPTRVLSGLEG